MFLQIISGFMPDSTGFCGFYNYKPVKIAFLQQCHNKRCLIFVNIAQFCCAIQFFNRIQNILVAASMPGLRLTT